MQATARPPQVLEQFVAGELGAFEALFRQYQGEVYGWVVRIVRDPAAAEDLTVETFWRIYRARARFDASRSFAAWARTIATHAALDHLKQARIQETPLEDQPVEPASGKTGDPALRREMRDRIQLAFGQLPAKLRVVAMLALIEECPHAEIAEGLAISPAAVKSRLFRAMRLLRRKLGNLGHSHE